MKDSDAKLNETELQRRGRGRPKRNDTTAYQPAPVIERNKRVTKELAKQTTDDSNSIETIKTPLLVLYDHIHDNVREAITQNTDSAENVRLGKNMQEALTNKSELTEIDQLSKYEWILEKIRNILGMGEENYTSD